MHHARYRYYIAAAIVVALGVASRIFVTGNILIDKYLGDALYAVLLYLVLRIWRPDQSRRDHANWAMSLVFVIELFQMTGIPASMRQSDSLLARLASIVLGTQFSWLDIVAYAVGILAAYGIDFRYRQESS